MLTNYSIALLSYNHPELTGKAIDSILSYGFDSNKFFLIHNGSESQHVLFLNNKYPNLQHIVLPENKGYSGGANAGLNQIFKVEKNILFLTNDIEIIGLSETFPENLDFFSISIFKRNTAQIDSLIGAINLRTGKLTHIKSKHALILQQNFIKTYIPGTAFGITRNAFMILGGFDESLHTYWEDVDLSLRAHAAKNLRIGFSDNFKVKHKIGKTCHKHRFYTLYLYQRNRKRILKKYGSVKILFYLNYGIDMAHLLIKIMKSNHKKGHFLLWWKALND